MEPAIIPELLKQSPHDAEPGATQESSEGAKVESWVPSRYNMRVTAEDGRLIIWNTLRGSMSVFKAEQAQQVLKLLSSRQGFDAPLSDMLVKYLMVRGHLVKKETDEFRLFQLLYGRQQYRLDVLELILLPSEDCNFRCRYCYEKFARGTMKPEVRQGIKKLVEARLPALNRLYVEWFGGEPLYGWPAVEELGPWLAQQAEAQGVSYSSAMTTNGYLLTPDVAEKLLAWKVNFFQITLDGPPERHNISRPARDGSATFERIFDNLKSLARRKDEFGVMLRYNYDATNNSDAPRLFDLVKKELGADSRFWFHFHAVGKWGGGNDENLEVCGTSGFDVATRLKAQAQERGLNVETLRMKNLPGGQVCYAARPYSFIVGASGKLMKCTVALDTDERNIIGHITPSGVLDIDADRMAAWSEPAFQRDSQCQKCVILPNCQGNSCPLVRMNSGMSPCLPTRLHGKRQLLETLKYHDASGRFRSIPMMSR
jgi:uncharacterized protein